MSLKKLFPVIIIMITLSLMGIIYIQFHWLRIMLVDREEEFSWKVVSGVVDASQQLVQEKSNLPSFKSFRSRPGFSFPSDIIESELMKPGGVAQHFSELEIREKLRQSFNNQGLPKLNFEFAIINASMMRYEMKTAKYETLLLENKTDSLRNLEAYYPLQVPSGSDWENLVPDEQLGVIVPNIKKIVLKQMQWMIIGAIFFTMLIIAAFYITMYALIRQKKLSEIKNDFINNMTHEFKTPLATISLAVDALKNEKVIKDPEKMEYFRGIIKEENKRMNLHVESILQAAVMDRQEIKLSKETISIHDMLQEILEHYHLQLEEKKATLSVQLLAQRDQLQADPVHFRNMLSNLIDNAIKYSSEGLQLTIDTVTIGNAIQIRVQDNGIGMSKETTKRIFEKFYRAHTGNLHNVKGFGLGLSYVKAMVDAHNGKIKVDSIPGRGTTFTLHFSLKA